MESALLDQLWPLLDDARAQSESDQARLQAELDNVQTSIDVLHASLKSTLDVIERGLDSQALRERLERDEADLRGLEERSGQLQGRLQALDRPLLCMKVSRLQDVAIATPSDRQAFNPAARSLFEKVMIDYPRGELVFHGRGGGRVSEMVFK